jgi:hypothetical protein
MQHLSALHPVTFCAVMTNEGQADVDFRFRLSPAEMVSPAALLAAQCLMVLLPGLAFWYPMTTCLP